MHCRLLCAGLLASAVAGAGAAVAADFTVRPAPPVVAPAVVAPSYISEWAGFYLGIHGGGGWGHTSFDVQDQPSETVFPNASPKGGVFGFQFGHNWQWGPVVGGLEIDYSFAHIKESAFFFSEPIDGADDPTLRDSKIDALASARGRLGYVVVPNWLLYGTAGIAWSHSRLNVVDLEAPVSHTTFSSDFGWVAGVGLEYKFWDHWLLRGEWLHYDFGQVSHPVGLGEDVENFNLRTRVDVARAALSYKF